MMYLKRFTGLLMLLLIPYAVDAATLVLVPSPAKANQEFSVEVRINPEGEALNAVEGSIRIPEDMHVVRVSTGGSAFAVWPVVPAYSRSTSEISFTGGVMGSGLMTSGESLLFTIHATAPAQGTYTLSSENVYGFRADGTGTPVALASSKTDVSVGTEAITPENLIDIDGPREVVAELGSDPALFDNAPYVYLYALDDGSGIARYSVKEGWFAPYISTDQYYLLKDATAGNPVWVEATDVKGNNRRVHVDGTGGLLYQIFAALPYLLTVLVLAMFAWMRLRR